VGAGCVLVYACERFATFSVLEPLLLFLQLFPLGLQLGVRTGNLGGRRAPFPHFEENLGRAIRVIVDYFNVVLVFDPVAIGHRLAFGKKNWGFGCCSPSLQAEDEKGPIFFSAC
jgi:hypothetical protein